MIPRQLYNLYIYKKCFGYVVLSNNTWICNLMFIAKVNVVYCLNICYYHLIHLYNYVELPVYVIPVFLILMICSVVMNY